MYKFKFADIGEGIHEAIITDVLVKENDWVNEGDVVISVETDKVTTDITSPVSGVIKKCYFQTSDQIFVGDTLFEIEQNQEEEKQEQDEIMDKDIQEKKDMNENQWTSQDDATSDESVSVVGSLKTSNDMLPNFGENKIINDNVTSLISPLARKLAHKNNIDLNTIVGTGPNGRILLQDIEKKLNANDDSVVLDKVDDAINNHQLHNEVAKKVEASMIRQTIAKAMIKTKQTIPEASMFCEIDVSLLVKLKTTLKQEFNDKKINLTYLPFIIKALVLALKKHEQFNSTFDLETKTITYKYFYNFGIAMDGPNGLVVPVLKNVDKDSLELIAQKLSDLTNKVKENKLTINEMKNSTFSISNYGTFGILYATPIINYPESAIIGIGKITQQIKVDRNKTFVFKYILPVSLTIDHRIIDGADGGRFLQTLTNLLENPESLL